MSPLHRLLVASNACADADAAMSPEFKHVQPCSRFITLLHGVPTDLTGSLCEQDRAARRDRVPLRGWAAQVRGWADHWTDGTGFEPAAAGDSISIDGTAAASLAGHHPKPSHCAVAAHLLAPLLKTPLGCVHPQNVLQQQHQQTSFHPWTL